MTRLDALADSAPQPWTQSSPSSGCSSIQSAPVEPKLKLGRRHSHLHVLVHLNRQQQLRSSLTHGIAITLLPDCRREHAAVVPTVLSVLVTAGFAGAAYGAARHGGVRDVALVAADYCVTYYVLAALCFCLWKLELLRQRDDPESAAQRRRVSVAAWAVSVALGVNIASHVTDATVPYYLPLKIAVWVLAGVATGVAGYLFFFSRGRPRADAGRRSEEEEPLHVHGVSADQSRVCEV